MYAFDGTEYPHNPGTGIAGIVFILKSANYIIQMLINRDGIYTRRFVINTTEWGNWQSYLTNSELTPVNLQTNVNSSGQILKSGDDLDNLTTPGTWACTSFDVAKNLKNTPLFTSFNSGFRLDIYVTGEPCRIQRLMAHDATPKIFYRSKYSDNWNAWKEVSIV